MSIKLAKSPLTEFCEKRHVPKQIQNAFGAYVRTYYAERFRMNSEGETVHLILGRMSQEDLEDAWQDFVKAIVRYLPSTQKPT